MWHPSVHLKPRKLMGNRMNEITVWINAATLERMTQKIFARSQKITPSTRNPYSGLTVDQSREFVWKNVKKEVTQHCSSPNANLNNLKLALIFGAPLDDTVFMLTGCEFPGDSVPHEKFSVEYNEGASKTFIVDFYAMV